MTFVQKLPGKFTITDPGWPVYRPLPVLASDDFSGTGEIVGDTTNSVLGGSPMTWRGTTGSWVRQGGVLHSPVNGGELYLAAMPADVGVQVTLARGPNPDASRDAWVNLTARATADRANRVVLEIFNKNRTLRFKDRVGGSQVLGQAATGAYEDGDTIMLRVVGDRAQALVNGTVVLEQVTPITGVGDVVLSDYPAGYDHQAILDDFMIVGV